MASDVAVTYAAQATGLASRIRVVTADVSP
jgi:hypothetical protein